MTPTQKQQAAREAILAGMTPLEALKAGHLPGHIQRALIPHIGFMAALDAVNKACVEFKAK